MSKAAGILVAAAAATACMTAAPALASGGSAKPIANGQYQWGNDFSSLTVTVSKTGRRVWMSYTCEIDQGQTPNRHPVAIRNGRFVVHAKRNPREDGGVGGTDKIAGRFMSGKRIRLTTHTSCGNVTAKYIGQVGDGGSPFSS